MSELGFKKISIDDKKIIETFTLDSDIKICDFAFSNMFGWGQLYDLCWCIVEDSLVMRFFSPMRNEYVYLPIISSKDANVEKAISKILQKEKTITLASVTKEYKTYLSDTFGDKVSFEKNRNSYDYIYDINSLRTLSGKKLQSKRNHINKFKQAHPNYKVVEIDDSNVFRCLELEKRWLKEQEQTESREQEKKMIFSVLQNRKELGLLAIAIELDGEIVAFSVGSAINRDTFGVHVEKADHNINGCFTIINQEFCNMIPQQYKYVNREEDMGIEGLRKSKESYQPTILLEKDFAYIKR